MIITICFWVLGGVGIICLGWRIRCKWKTTPWPYWLSFWLENPFMILFCNKNKISDHLRKISGPSILEIGCGAGRICVPFAKKLNQGETILAVDIQDKMLDKAIKYSELNNTQAIEFNKMDWGQHNSIKRLFDLVYLVTVIGEIPDLKNSLSCIFKSLKPKGILSITETIPDPCYIPAFRIKKIALSIGFKVLDHKRGLFTYIVDLQKP